MNCKIVMSWQSNNTRDILHLVFFKCKKNVFDELLNGTVIVHLTAPMYQNVEKLTRLKLNVTECKLQTVIFHTTLNKSQIKRVLS